MRIRLLIYLVLIALIVGVGYEYNQHHLQLEIQNLGYGIEGIDQIKIFLKERNLSLSDFVESKALQKEYQVYLIDLSRRSRTYQ